MYVVKDIILIQLIVTVIVINCNCNCKSCGIGEYLDYLNCKCRKKLIDSLVEKCTENIDVTKVDNENEHIKECSSCTAYIVLFWIFL